MNGKRPMDRGDADDHGIDGEGLDPGLTELFHEPSDSLPDAEAFVSAVLKDIHRTQQRRLRRRLGGALVAIAASAFVAPYVGEQTLAAVGWLSDSLSSSRAALAAPPSGACAG